MKKFRKIAALLLCLTLCAGLLPMPAYAEDSEADPAGEAQEAELPAEGAAVPGETPGTDEPGTGEPGTGEPGTDEPGTGEPGTEEPGTGEPGTDEPGTGEPGTDEPGTEEPDAEDPDAEAADRETLGKDDPGYVEPDENGNYTVVNMDQLNYVLSITKGSTDEIHIAARSEDGSDFILDSVDLGCLDISFHSPVTVSGDVTSCGKLVFFSCLSVTGKLTCDDVTWDSGITTGKYNIHPLSDTSRACELTSAYDEPDFISQMLYSSGSHFNNYTRDVYVRGYVELNNNLESLQYCNLFIASSAGLTVNYTLTLNVGEFSVDNPMTVNGKVVLSPATHVSINDAGNLRGSGSIIVRDDGSGDAFSQFSGTWNANIKEELAARMDAVRDEENDCWVLSVKESESPAPPEPVPAEDVVHNAEELEKYLAAARDDYHVTAVTKDGSPFVIDRNITIPYLVSVAFESPCVIESRKTLTLKGKGYAEFLGGIDNRGTIVNVGRISITHNDSCFNPGNIRSGGSNSEYILTGEAKTLEELRSFNAAKLPGISNVQKTVCITGTFNIDEDLKLDAGITNFYGGTVTVDEGVTLDMGGSSWVYDGGRVVANGTLNIYDLNIKDTGTFEFGPKAGFGERRGGVNVQAGSREEALKLLTLHEPEKHGLSLYRISQYNTGSCYRLEKISCPKNEDGFYEIDHYSQLREVFGSFEPEVKAAATELIGIYDTVNIPENASVYFPFGIEVPAGAPITNKGFMSVSEKLHLRCSLRNEGRLEIDAGTDIACQDPGRFDEISNGIDNSSASLTVKSTVSTEDELRAFMETKLPVIREGKGSVRALAAVSDLSLTSDLATAEGHEIEVNGLLTVGPNVTFNVNSPLTIGDGAQLKVGAGGTLVINSDCFLRGNARVEFDAGADADSTGPFYVDAASREEALAHIEGLGSSRLYAVKSGSGSWAVGVNSLDESGPSGRVSVRSFEELEALLETSPTNVQISVFNGGRPFVIKRSIEILYDSNVGISFHCPVVIPVNVVAKLDCSTSSNFLYNLCFYDDVTVYGRLEYAGHVSFYGKYGPVNNIVRISGHNASEDVNVDVSSEDDIRKALDSNTSFNVWMHMRKPITVSSPEGLRIPWSGRLIMENDNGLTIAAGSRLDLEGGLELDSSLLKIEGEIKPDSHSNIQLYGSSVVDLSAAEHVIGVMNIRVYGVSSEKEALEHVKTSGSVTCSAAEDTRFNCYNVTVTGEIKVLPSPKNLIWGTRYTDYGGGNVRVEKRSGVLSFEMEPDPEASGLHFDIEYFRLSEDGNSSDPMEGTNRWWDGSSRYVSVDGPLDRWGKDPDDFAEGDYYATVQLIDDNGGRSEAVKSSVWHYRKAASALPAVTGFKAEYNAEEGCTHISFDRLSDEYESKVFRYRIDLYSNDQECFTMRYCPPLDDTPGEFVKIAVWDSQLNEDYAGFGDYTLNVLALSQDEGVIRSGPVASYSHTFTDPNAMGKSEMQSIANDSEKTPAEIREAARDIQDLDKLLVAADNTEIRNNIIMAEEKAGTEVIVDTAPDAAIPAGAEIYGAAFNEPDDSSAPIVLKIGKPVGEVELPEDCDHESVIAFSMTLENAGDASHLQSPVRIELPIPYNMAEGELVLLHYHDGKAERVPYTLGRSKNGGSTACFVIDGFSNFVLTLRGSESGDLNSDGDINTLDLTILMHQLCGGEKPLLAADMNYDNRVDIMDLVSLMRLISGEDVFA